jgi:hypothetical protein
MKTQAMLMGMRYYSPQECEITKVVTLTDQDYNYFRNNLLRSMTSSGTTSTIWVTKATPPDACW